MTSLLLGLLLERRVVARSLQHAKTLMDRNARHIVSASKNKVDATLSEVGKIMNHIGPIGYAASLLATSPPDIPQTFDTASKPRFCEDLDLRVDKSPCM